MGKDIRINAGVCNFQTKKDIIHILEVCADKSKQNNEVFILKNEGIKDKCLIRATCNSEDRFGIYSKLSKIDKVQINAYAGTFKVEVLFYYCFI